jgi:indole-3-glycerol phosphate synthase
LLAATPNDNGMISSRLNNDKVVALYNAHKDAGQDCLILSMSAQKLKEKGVTLADLVDLGDTPIHTDEVALLLTKEDVNAFRENAIIFQKSGLETPYNFLWLRRPDLENIIIPNQ